MSTKKILRYTVKPGNLKLAKLPAVRSFIKQVLSEPKGWKSKGYSFHEADSKDSDAWDFQMSFLTDKNIVEKYSERWSGYSVCENQKFIYFNLDNWKSGAKSGYTDIRDYQRYLINHEVGHVLGYGHIDPKMHCKKGNRASVMSQQTIGQFGCTPSPYVEGSKLPSPGSLFIQGGHGDSYSENMDGLCSIF